MTYTKKTWRLIKTPPAHGPWNMAVDEAVLEAVGKGTVPPTLRLYAWKPPCLSLGYAQSVADVSLEELTSQGWEIVRRPTGGRAILHTDELTYSVIGPHDDPHLAGGILESYSNLSQALLSALHMLGIPAEAQESSADPDASRIERGVEKNKNPVCFEIPSNYEITVNENTMVNITVNSLGLFFIVFLSHYGYTHQSPTSQAGQGLLNWLRPKSSRSLKTSSASTSASHAKSPIQGSQTVQGLKYGVLLN